MSDKGPYGKVSRGRMKEGTPELCRRGTGTSGNRELNRGSGDVNSNAELNRPGVIAATMPELDRSGGFSGGSFVNRIGQVEQLTESPFEQVVTKPGSLDLIPGHKRLAGMP